MKEMTLVCCHKTFYRTATRALMDKALYLADPSRLLVLDR